MNNIITEDEKNFYGDYLADLLYAEKSVLQMIEEYNQKEHEKHGDGPVEYCISRIKRADSMRKKLEKKDLPITGEVSITQLTDAVGIRIICGFIDDVYQVAHWLNYHTSLKTITEKDYISHPKENGYRSYHIITQIKTPQKQKIFVEIQIRTIAQDCWANLEHQMKYKREIKNQRLIQQELKRCADEIASADISMQTIRELICQ